MEKAGRVMFLQRHRLFLIGIHISEKIIQSENLSRFTFILITYKFGLVFYRLTGLVKFSCSLA